MGVWFLVADGRAFIQWIGGEDWEVLLQEGAIALPESVELDP